MLRSKSNLLKRSDKKLLRKCHKVTICVRWKVVSLIGLWEWLQQYPLKYDHIWRQWTHRDNSHLHPFWAQVYTHNSDSSNIAEIGEDHPQTNQSPHPCHHLGHQDCNISDVEFLWLSNQFSQCQHNIVVSPLCKMDKFLITFKAYEQCWGIDHYKNS